MNYFSIKERFYFDFRGLVRLLFVIFFIVLPFTRELGGLNLVVFSISFILITPFLIKNLKGFYSLFALSVLAVFYAFLSYFEVFPSVWTRYFEPTAIPQQALFGYSFLFSMIIMIYFIKDRVFFSDAKRSFAVLMFFIWVFYKLISIFNYNEAYQSDGFLKGVFSIVGMGSFSAVIIVGTAIFLSTVGSLTSKILILFFFTVFSFMSPFSQNYIYAVFFALVWFFPRYSYFFLVGMIISAIAFYSFFIFDPLAVRAIDVNLTVRLVLIRDAIIGGFQSGLLGVGFGTEGIINYYSLFYGDFYDENDSGFINLAVHNSYATIFFRLGFIGLFLFLIFISKTFIKIRSVCDIKDRAVCVSVFGAFFIVTFLNPAMESFIYLYGAALYLAVIWAFVFKYEKSIFE